MKATLLILACLKYMTALMIDAIKLRCYESPFDACLRTNSAGIVAQTDTLPCLVQLLKDYNIQSAFVFGWNDHNVLMVLRSNGALAPYDEFTNNADYVFVVLNCPCPYTPVYASGNNQQPTPAVPSTPSISPCHPTPAVPSTPSVSPCHPTPAVPSTPSVNPCPAPIVPINPCYTIVCPPVPKPCRPCDESSSSSSSASEHNKCLIFEQTTKKCKKNKTKCPKTEIELDKKSKKYILNMCGPKKGEAVVTLCEQNVCLTQKKYIIPKNPKKGQFCKELPCVFKNPRKIQKILKCLHAEFDPNACLYISKDNKFYAIINGEFYSISLKRHHHKLTICTRKVSPRHLKKLIKEGLYGVSVESYDS